MIFLLKNHRKYNVVKLTQFAAMFGLDARIALAIFGALSVITGVALYSAIEKAETVAIATDMSEIVKAFEHYYIDTRIMLPLTDGGNYCLKDLVTSTKKGWKGPYIGYKTKYNSIAHYNNCFLDYSKIKDNNVFMTKARHSDFLFDTTSNTSDARNACPSENDCALYLTINRTQANGELRTLALKLDKLIDNGDGLKKGKLRMQDFTGLADYIYYLIGDLRSFN